MRDGKYILVRSDSLGITDRVKEIDNSYFILLNRKSEKFEIHSSLQKDGTFCLELPFPFLDARTLTYVRKYRRERINDIIEEMDRENEKLQAREKAKREDVMGEALEKARRKRK